MKAAVIAAVVAALVGSSGTYAATRIDGRSIRPHSIPLNRLVKQPAPSPSPAEVAMPVCVDRYTGSMHVEAPAVPCSASESLAEVVIWSPSATP